MVNFIICEFDPFHNGHEYLMKKASGAPTVCIMSGHITQRGTFAMTDKWTRAEAALLCGADLVLELPAAAACGSAIDFARGAIAAANATGLAGRLCFGTEGDVLQDLKSLAALSKDAVQKKVKTEIKNGASSAAAMMAAYRTLAPKKSEILKSPNNLLAFEYIKANEKFDLYALPRTGVSHDAETPVGKYASASYLRQHIDEIHAFVPADVLPLYKKMSKEGRILDADRAELIITAALRRTTKEEWEAACPGGLGARLFTAFENETTLSSAIDAVKSKCFTHSEIRRAVLRTYCGLRPLTDPLPYLRVLGLNKTGAALLRRMRPTAPLLVKPAGVCLLPPEARDIFTIDMQITDAFGFFLHTPQPKGWEYRSPVVIK